MVGITPTKKKKGGIGGAIGSVLGAVGGVVATVATGGAAWPAIAGGAALGKQVGTAVDPGKEVASPTVQNDSSAISRKLEGMQGGSGPELSQDSQMLRDSMIALNDAPGDVQDSYKEMLAKATMKSLSSDWDKYRGRA